MTCNKTVEISLTHRDDEGTTVDSEMVVLSHDEVSAIIDAAASVALGEKGGVERLIDALLSADIVNEADITLR